MLMAALWCLIGLGALIIGAELLTRAGTRLAALMRIPPIIIGLTIVSVGTSLPELAVGLEAARLGAGDLAIGNIAGTNTFNLLFILGLSAVIAPIVVATRTIRIELPAMILAALAMLAVVWDGGVSRAEGAAMAVAAIIYTVYLILSARRGVGAEEAAGYDDLGKAAAGPVWRSAAVNLGLLVLAIVVVLTGSEWLVSGAVELSRALGVSEAVIGLTVVAVGTSSPELVTTIVSTLRGQRDIAVGNLLGSGVYNILLILGATAALTPGGLSAGPVLIAVDVPVMLAATLLCLPVFLSSRLLSRAEGGLMVLLYLAYMVWIVAVRT